MANCISPLLIFILQFAQDPKNNFFYKRFTNPANETLLKEVSKSSLKLEHLKDCFNLFHGTVQVFSIYTTNLTDSYVKL